MRFKLLRRRLTVSAPRVAIRSDLPWPLRWALIALTFGFSAAIALWAFEFGKGIAGLDAHSQAELTQLREEVALLREERERVRAASRGSDSLLMADKTTQERITAHLKQLEAENRSLRDDLGFFEKLVPAGAAESIAIRRLQAEVLPAGMQLRWQVLVMQPQKNAPDFNGKLELSVSGLQNGKPWSMSLPGGPQVLQLRQYRRVEGVLDLPPQAVVKSITAKVLEGAVTKATHTISL